MSMCVLTAAAAAVVVVTGKPHARCSSHDDYATAFAYYQPAAVAVPSPPPPTAFELPPPSSYPVEYADAAAPPCRSGRSNGHDRPSGDGPSDDVPPPPPPPPPAPPAARHPVKLTAATLGPCKGPSAPVSQAPAANDTASLTVERLTAYYDRLKAQQELLARRQIEMQLLEQQQRRQREYAMVQQQIQQQYYQQQQHAMAMLDQLHRNPAFVGQMAAYMEQRLKANNGTVAKAVVPVPPAVPEGGTAAVPPDVVAAAAASATKAGGGDGVGHGARSHAHDGDQNIRARHHDPDKGDKGDDGDDEDDEDDEDDKDDKVDKVDKDDDKGCGGELPAKRVEPRQVAGRNRARRIGARDADAWTDDLADDRRRRSEDDAIVEKVFGMISE